MEPKKVSGWQSVATGGDLSTEVVRALLPAGLADIRPTKETEPPVSCPTHWFSYLGQSAAASTPISKEIFWGGVERHL